MPVVISPTPNSIKRTQEIVDEDTKKLKLPTSTPFASIDIGNSVREKCVEMMYNCFEVSKTNCTEQQSLLSICMEVERQLFECSGKQTDAKYKASFRSKYLNLKDKSNPSLRNCILTGKITPERFISMTTAVRKVTCLYLFISIRKWQVKKGNKKIP